MLCTMSQRDDRCFCISVNTNTTIPNSVGYVLSKAAASDSSVSDLALDLNELFTSDSIIFVFSITELSLSLRPIKLHYVLDSC